jgi:hypothetical protein
MQCNALLQMTGSGIYCDDDKKAIDHDVWQHKLRKRSRGQSHTQRFQVVRLAGRATGPTYRLVTIRTTTWMIYRGRWSRRRIPLSQCVEPSSRRRGAGQGRLVAQIGARQSGLGGSAGQSRTTTLGGAGWQH